MTSAKTFQIRSLLNRLLNYGERLGFVEEDFNLSHNLDRDKIINNLIEPDSDQTNDRDILFNIGPRLDIQAGIDLFNRYKNIPQQIKVININLQGAQTAHGAVLQTLRVIQKSCLASGKILIVRGLSSELMAFFHLAGLSDLVGGNQEIDNI